MIRIATLRPSTLAVSLHLHVCHPHQAPTCLDPQKIELPTACLAAEFQIWERKGILSKLQLGSMIHKMTCTIWCTSFFLPLLLSIQSAPVQWLAISPVQNLVGIHSEFLVSVSLRSWTSTTWPCQTLSWACWNYSEPLGSLLRNFSSSVRSERCLRKIFKVRWKVRLVARISRYS